MSLIEKKITVYNISNLPKGDNNYFIDTNVLLNLHGLNGNISKEEDYSTLIEIIIGSIIAVYALQILLYGVNGVLIQLTDMVSKIGVLRNKNYQKNYLSNSVKGKQYQPELLGNTFDLLKNTEFKENVKTLASVLNTSNP